MPVSIRTHIPFTHYKLFDSFMTTVKNIDVRGVGSWTFNHMSMICFLVNPDTATMIKLKYNQDDLDKEFLEYADTFYKNKYICGA